MRNCYLDTVPGDCLRTVLRNLSLRPKHHNWHTYISANSVDTTVDVGGALARAAIVEFIRFGGTDGIPLRSISDLVCLRRLVYKLPARRLVVQHRVNNFFRDLIRGCRAESRDLVLDARYDVYPITEPRNCRLFCS